MKVDRCVCFDVTFQQLRDYVDRHGGPEAVSLDDLQQVFNCGRGCGLCTAYIKMMLRTGRTSFPVVPPTPNDSTS